MYQIVHGSTQNLEDVQAFIAMLDKLYDHPIEAVRNLFDPNAELVVTRAPGRLDIMGGIADYSGSMILEQSLSEATLVALQRDPTRDIHIVSLRNDANEALEFQMSLGDFEGDGRWIDYVASRLFFQRDKSRRWAAYVAGAFLVLMRERGVGLTEGARILIQSNVPEAKGVSSSAALEVAVMQALVAAFDLDIEPSEIALLCQKVENLVADAPCGVMDQMTSVFGEPDRLFAMECQPANVHPSSSIPENISFWGIDSGIRHSVSGGDYGSVRTGAFMGYRIIASIAGLKAIKTDSGQVVQIEDSKWNGYLCNITPYEFERYYSSLLPEQIIGREFLSRYQGTTDAVTSIDSERSYAVRTPTAHPIYENVRVRAFAEMLTKELDESSLVRLGEMMYQSHDSYSACGLGSWGTDRIVEMVKSAGPDAGLYGAKITGGGCGGTVAVLGRSTAGDVIKEIAGKYARETGYPPRVFHGSSCGAARFGHLELVGRMQKAEGS